MQQLEEINRKVEIRELGQIRGVKNSHFFIVLLALSVFLILLNGGVHGIVVGVFGWILPAWCLLKGVKISQYYWVCIAGLFWLRLIFHQLICFDGILALCLWHPNINLSERIYLGCENLYNQYIIVWYRRYRSLL